MPYNMDFHCVGMNEDLTFVPVINASSERMLEDSAQLPGRFLQRQRFFYDLKQQRMRILQAEVRPAAPAFHLYLSIISDTPQESSPHLHQAVREEDVVLRMYCFLLDHAP